MDLETKNKMLIEINEKPEDIITAVQNDTNSRYLDVYLYDNGTPIDLTDCEVRICAIKPSDTGEVWNNGEITEATNGRCQFLLTTDMLATVGVMETQIQIWQNNTNILSTEIFNIYVTRSLLGETSVESSNEYGALVVLFQNLYEALYLMEQMVNSFGTAGTVAEARNILTFWEGIEYIAKYVDTTLAQKIDDVIAQATVQGVLDLIGTAADTGATATEGTVMGKLNVLLSAEQERADDVVIYSKIDITTMESAATITPISISGKGRIAYMKFLNNGGNVQIKIDGNVVSQKDFDYLHSYSWIIVNPFKNNRAEKGVVRMLPLEDKIAFIETSTSWLGANNNIPVKYFPEVDDLTFSSTSILMEDLKFNSSVEVIGTNINSSTDAYWTIYYVLE